MNKSQKKSFVSAILMACLGIVFILVAVCYHLGVQEEIPFLILITLGTLLLGNAYSDYVDSKGDKSDLP